MSETVDVISNEWTKQMSDDDQLSTVQQLWRDRRPEFEAYLDGELECVCQNQVLTNPKFGLAATAYTFRPKPKRPAPPKLRPLTHEEWRDRRDWWVREKTRSKVMRIIGISEGYIDLDDRSIAYEQAFTAYEMSSNLNTWYLCGVLSSEVTK